jgi:hypothetical protein
MVELQITTGTIQCVYDVLELNFLALGMECWCLVDICNTFAMTPMSGWGKDWNNKWGAIIIVTGNKGKLWTVLPLYHDPAATY